MSRFITLVFALLLWSSSALSDPTGLAKISWSNGMPIHPETPLEIKLGTFGKGENPDALVVTLWNDGSSNRLDAVRIPFPYNGSGITTTPLASSGTLFALGDICNIGSIVLVPYIKDFNVEVARFSGSGWSTSTIPGTTTNNFDNADCGVTSERTVILTHDQTDGETELYQTQTGGLGYTFYGRYVSAGPFDGASREPLATTFGSRYAMGLNQQSNGQIRATRIDTQPSMATFTHTNIRTAPPPAGFTFVKESAARANLSHFFFTYNADGNARTVTAPINNPGAFTERDLGAVDNMGSQYTFQGSTLLNIEAIDGPTNRNNILWGDYFIVNEDNSGPLATDPDYPLQGVGGPIDGCVVHRGEARWQAFAGPRVGSDGTDMYWRNNGSTPIFADGFESGDTTSWSNCD